MKIVLKDDWDIPIHPPVEGAGAKGHFVGRDKELSFLSNELSRRDSGSILITGYRGVGKTSVVYRAIANVRVNDSNVVPIFISASQLQPDSPTNPALKAKSGAEPTPAPSAKRLIIESIIRRLYATTRDDKRLKDFRPAIEELYRKAVAATFEEIDRTSKSDTASAIAERVETVQFRPLSLIGFGLCFTVAIVLQLVPSLANDIGVKIISLLLAGPIPVAISYTVKLTSSSKSSLATAKQAEEVYRFDGSIGNLEFDLEKLHRNLSREKMKLIYVIDELDKLEKVEVSELLKFFKNLFTLSEALFIFIADEEIYGYGWATAPDQSTRPREYTYFTSRYFLSRPTYADLHLFLREIIETAEGTEDEIETFLRSVCFTAANDFFDLRGALVDKIVRFEEKKPVIDIPSVSAANEQQSRFHKVVSTLFEDKYMDESRSKWQENENLQRSLFRHLKELQTAFAGHSVADPQGDDVNSSLIRDCNALLSRVGALKIQQEDTKQLRGLSVPIRSYSYVGVIPESPPNQLSEPSEFERRYISDVEKYFEFVRAIRNAFRIADDKPEISTSEFSGDLETSLETQWDYNFWDPVQPHFELYTQFSTEEPLPVIQRADIERKTKEIANVTTSLLTNALPTVVAKMLMELYPIGKLRLNRLSENPSLFASLEVIRGLLQKRNPNFVWNQKHEVAVAHGESEEIRRAAEELRDLQKSHRVILIDDFGDSNRVHTYSVYFVNRNTPESLKISLARVLQSTTAFWSSKKTSDEDEE